jgi:hypothetical protein
MPKDDYTPPTWVEEIKACLPVVLLQIVCIVLLLLALSWFAVTILHISWPW